MSELPKLKPCPFCGYSNPKITGNGIGDYYVICDGEEDESFCGARSSDFRCEDPEFAAERWNRRQNAVEGKVDD